MATPPRVEFFEHPEYKCWKPKWELYRDLYEGEHGVMRQSKYLWPHEIESAENAGGSKLRGVRENRSRYTNLIEPVISRWTGLFFKEDPELDSATETLIKPFAEDVDGKGKSLVAWIKEDVLKAYLLTGWPIIFVDADPGVATTQAEVDAQGLRPYLTVLDPIDVRDWQLERYGAQQTSRYKSLRCEYQMVAERSSLTQEPTVYLYCKVLSLREGTYVLQIYRQEKDIAWYAKHANEKATWILHDQRVLANWSELPVVGLQGRSWIVEAAEQQLKLFNHESALDNQLDAQAYQRVFVAGELDDKQKVALGTHVINFIPEGAVVQLIEPSDTTPLEKRIVQDIDMLYKVAFNMQHTLPADSKEAPGMESQRQALEDVKNLVISSIIEIEELVNESLRFAAKYYGNNSFSGKVTLHKDITIEDIDQMQKLAMAHRDDMKRCPEWNKAWLKKVARYMNLSEIEDIEDEIDKLDWSAEIEAQEKILENQANPELGGGPADRLKAKVNGQPKAA